MLFTHIQVVTVAATLHQRVIDIHCSDHEPRYVQHTKCSTLSSIGNQPMEIVRGHRGRRMLRGGGYSTGSIRGQASDAWCRHLYSMPLYPGAAIASCLSPFSHVITDYPLPKTIFILI